LGTSLSVFVSGGCHGCQLPPAVLICRSVKLMSGLVASTTIPGTDSLAEFAAGTVRMKRLFWWQVGNNLR